MKERKEKVANTKNNKGFTLIELLVVVLIIGILAAIALPQYKMAVGKSKYATLKNITKSLRGSVERYYLINNILPTKFSDLDIDLSITYESPGNSSFWIYFPGAYCEIWHTSDNSNIRCIKKIFGVEMVYTKATLSFTTVCTTYSIDTNDISNRICQIETGKSAEQAVCTTNRCNYAYRAG